MKNISLLTVFFLILFSTSSFGGGFDKRWFWFYVKDEEKDAVKITYSPENKESNAIHTEDQTHGYNPSPDLTGSWYRLFDYATQVATGKLAIDKSYSLSTSTSDPLFKHIFSTGRQVLMFHPEKHTKPKNLSLANYRKVVFKSTLGDTLVVYLEEINDSDFRVSAIFVEDNRGERYSYRDYCFKRDYDDQSGGGNGGTTIANFLSYQQHHCSNKIDIKSMSINDTPDTINKKKSNLFEILFTSPFLIYIYSLKSF